MSDTAARTAAVVLAAGRGTRMVSERAKVLHPLLGWPLVAFPVRAALDAGVGRVVVVVGHQGDDVYAAARACAGGADVLRAEQPEQRGTGHALQCALAATDGCDQVLVLCGDVPALDAASLAAILAAHAADAADLTVVSFDAPDPTGYGRVVRGEDGRPRRIVEHRDADAAVRALTEVNSGVYVVGRERLSRALAQIDSDNAAGELYLTDVVAVLAGEGARLQAYPLADPTLVAGVNTRAQLAVLEEALRRRRNHALMELGVTMRDPATTRVEMGASVAPDTVLGPGVELRGATAVASSCHIDTGAILTDCELAAGVTVRPYVVAQGVRFAADSAAGPFAHLRPGTVLGEHAKVGNFVETKQARIGAGSKASHLSYLGDCELGRDVNVGAGTITCNYDGFDKHRTVLGDGVFVGSDTQLVAPVTVGANATIAAGTTVTRDVPEGALVHSRIRQQVREGYFEQYRLPRRAQKLRGKAQDKDK
jgi:bifunctional UDP-N-acetylglucosamine pyrophosphorylase/glucosamine-1-phosphate N-acetyltransferase